MANKNHFIVLSLLWLLVHVLLFVHPGVRLDLFDSKVYATAGRYFFEHGHFEKNHQFFYALPIFLIGAFQNFQNGLVLFIIFQCLISAFATLALYYATAKLYNDSRAGLIAALFFLLWWDIIQWNTSLLTESLFCSLICFLFVHLMNFQDKRRDYFVLILLLLSSLATRPTGIIFILSSLVFLLVRHWQTLKIKPAFRQSVLFLVALFSFAGSVFMFSIWDFSDQYFRGNIITYIDTIQPIDSYFLPLRLDISSLIIPASSLAPIEKMLSFMYHNPIHFLKAGALKIFYLLSGIRPYYSTLHNLYTLCWMGFLYGLLVIGFRKISNVEIRSAVIAVIVVNCALIGIGTVDWDNRFYVPMVPGIILLSSGGALRLIKNFNRLRAM